MTTVHSRTTGAPVGSTAAAVDAVDVAAVLRRERALVEPALRAAVARLDPVSAAQSAYHLGWTDVDGTPDPTAGRGKALRPALALLAARVCGAAPEVAVPGGVAVELVHNFSLVHDDLMDGDTERRHRPTVWALWGPPSAVLTGDAMLTVAQEVLLEAASPHAAAAAHLLARTTRELVRGQVRDVAFERTRPDDVTVEDCLAMAAGKTGALLAGATGVGGVLAGAAADTVHALERYGAELGLAFQLVDDLLGIWGDPAVTGKPVLADLRARKKSLPVTWAVQHGGAAGRELASWLVKPVPPGGDDEAVVRRAAGLVEDAGGRAWAAEEVRRRLRAAEDALVGTGADADGGVAGDLGSIPDRAPTRRGTTVELVALGRSLADREA